MTATPEAAPATILLVDDAIDTLRMLTAALEADGMTVLVATDGASALAVTEHARPDLILMDAVMPGLDGFETTRRLKRDPARATIPVIFLTGLEDGAHAADALAAGGVDYVRKPVHLDELRARIRVHLANARSVASARDALDIAGRHLVALGPEGRLLWLTREAGRLLAAIDPSWDSGQPGLPPAVADAAARLLAGDDRASVRLAHDGGSLELSRLSAPSSGRELLVRLVAASEAGAVATLQARHSLTQREAQVLLWISYGKPNRVISEILGISPRTVNKHLEQIFEKLGVETRAAAAAIAVRTLGG